MSISPVTQYMACLVEQGNYAEAEAFVKKHGMDREGNELRYYLGIAYLRQQRVDDAIVEFKSILKSSPDEKVKKLMAELFIHQLDHKLAIKDYDGFSDYLEQVLSIDGDSGELKARLEKYKDYLPALYVKLNKREEAAKLWEEDYHKSGSPAVAHSLAILYYWWAKDLEDKKSPDAGKAWKKAIMYMVVLKHSKDYWREWKKRRESACSRKDDEFRIEDKDFDDLIDNRLINRIEKDLTGYLDRYSGDAFNVTRITKFLTGMRLELKGAAYYKKLIDIVGVHDKARYYPVCGSMFMVEMGWMPKVDELLRSVPSYGADKEVINGVKTYFSPLGSVLVLIENKKFTDAEKIIKGLPEDIKSSDAGVNTNVELYLEWGREELLRKNDVSTALTYWRAAKGLARYDSSRVKQRIEETLKEGGYQTRGDVDLDMVIRLYEGVVDILVDVSGDVRAFLSAKLYEKGTKFWDQGMETKKNNPRLKMWEITSFENSLGYFKRAYNHDPGNIRAKEMLATYYNNLAVDILDNDGDLEQAIRHLETARQYNNTDQICRNLSGAYARKGIKLLNKADAGLKYNNNPAYYAAEVEQAIGFLEQSIQLSYDGETNKALGYAYMFKAIIESRKYNWNDGRRYAMMAMRCDPSLVNIARNNGLL